MILAGETLNMLNGHHVPELLVRQGSPRSAISAVRSADDEEPKELDSDAPDEESADGDDAERMARMTSLAGTFGTNTRGRG